ncbi:protein O-mannosyl-transferase Tmtc3-like isoform X2 [Ornithodoros turicata]|uniref:protein O-mannosyl-transferase Tmtc3-like isoform X2 n=1 Tax=Ornithodoros turicata TaxID=34597 RepID=UPI0031389932
MFAVHSVEKRKSRDTGMKVSERGVEKEPTAATPPALTSDDDDSAWESCQEDVRWPSSSACATSEPATNPEDDAWCFLPGPPRCLGNMAASTGESSSSSSSPSHSGRKPSVHHVRWAWYLVVCGAASLCYANAPSCGFVFDDMSAVRDNRDLRPHTPLHHVFWNDFWGTPIHKEHSHKSYRPLCVLTFRINYWLHELDPMGYHIGNVLLHVIVCAIFLRVCSMVVPETPSVVAALLFAVHPVHTEAVTGVVGRAESLSSVFFLLAFIAYTHSTGRWKNTRWSSLLVCVVLIAVATLCKEQGITVVGVCAVYEIFVVQRLRPRNILHIIQTLLASKSSPPAWLREVFVRVAVLFFSAVALLVGRVKVMGAQLPVFTKFDNPAAVADTPTRQLTFNYLLPVNMWLLLFPSELCCDWTMGTIPLVQSFFDIRNLATLALYIAVVVLIYVAVTTFDDVNAHVIALSLSLMVLPFLPASNLFFPVGFVVAERILYMPSMGFCLLVAHGWHLLLERGYYRRLLWTALVILVVTGSIKTFIRNYDWESEYTIFMAGLKVNRQNAKLYNNVGHALEGQGKFAEALRYFLKASSVQADDIGAHINVGRTYNNLLMYDEAEAAFWKAKDLLPRPKPGEPYKARIAPNHLNVFLNLANLISRNGTRLEEADSLYKQAISMRVDYIQAYINRGDILIKLNRTREAQDVYERALQLDSTNPDIFYNLGVVFLEQGKVDDALLYFNKALLLDPDHEQALMNSAILIQESGSAKLRSVAYQRLKFLLQKGKRNERVYFNLGMLSMDDKNVEEAEDWFKKAIQVKQNFRSALFNLALLLSDSERPLEAVPYLKQLLQYHPDHVKGLILLGDVYINHVKDLNKAQECYEKILLLDPANVQALHNLCVVHVERGELFLAEKCLLKAQSLAPQEGYIEKHLRIVRNRIYKYQQHMKKVQAQGTVVDASSHSGPLTGEKPAASQTPQHRKEMRR